MNIYVGNLSYDTVEATLRGAFAAYGEVSNVSVIMDNQTGRSRGFGFVEMPSAAEARNAIAALNGTDIDGRNVTVNEARPREERSGGGRGFGGGNRGSGGGFGGGNRGSGGGFGGGNRGSGGGDRRRY